MVNTVVEGRRTLMPSSRESRIMAAATLLASIAFGIYTTGSVLYFTRFVGLPATQVGLGLSVAGVVWLPLSVLVGRFADRVGSRRATILTGLLQVAFLLLATQVRTVPQFYMLAVLLAAAEQGGWVCREALVADIIEREERVGAAAVVRSLFNTGVVLGSLVGGLALALDTRAAVAGLLIASAAVSAVATAAYSRLPEKRHTGTDVDTRVSMRQALWDRPYVVLSLLCGLLAMSDTILVVGVPLWITLHTALPHGLGAWLFGVNSLLVVVLQVRVSRGAETKEGARRLLIWACAAVAVACVLVAVTAVRSLAVGYVCLVLAVLALTMSELWSSASSWNFRYSLAPEAGQGVYGGVFALGSSLHLAVGPAVVTALTQRATSSGWLLLAGVFALVGLVCGPAADWAERSRRTPGPGTLVASPKTHLECP
ncbi:MFS transporter [Streptomyces tibetensis]|uniref:MFS transporter n=1 Tax=Streptomyces tibetensis TaxID=2382123 RepID=UPI0033C68CFA